VEGNAVGASDAMARVSGGHENVSADTEEVTGSVSYVRETPSQKIN